MMSQTQRDAHLEKAIISLLEVAPKYGYNVNTLRVKLQDASVVIIGHALLLETLHAMCTDGIVRRTPNTLLWRLA